MIAAPLSRAFGIIYDLYLRIELGQNSERAKNIADLCKPPPPPTLSFGSHQVVPKEYTH